MKKCQNCHHHIRFFFKLKMHQNPFSAGALPRTTLEELTTLPRPSSRLGGDTPSPFPSPLDAFGVSNWAPTAPWFSGPPQHKILATPVFSTADEVFCQTTPIPALHIAYVRLIIRL